MSKQNNSINDKTILITGGTGSFGKKCTESLLKNYNPLKLIIFSRDELKQFEMKQMFSDYTDQLRFFIGDVRDKDRLYRAFDGVDVVIHAAALKQVPSCEYNPIEAVKTNVIGAVNIIDAAIDQNVNRVIALSTDKAANPINLYGATKLCSDKLFVQGNAYTGRKRTRFSVVRYGNVIGSRGSVIPIFMKNKKHGFLPITDKKMTRFWITLEQGVNFVVDSLNNMQGGEIFVPKISSMSVTDLAKAICPKCKLKVVGKRPGEKVHETMISKEDAMHTIEFDNYYIIKPGFILLETNYEIKGKPVSEDFEYNSNTNSMMLTSEDLLEMIQDDIN